MDAWRTVEVTNGLITLVNVPDVGGRTMEFRLGDFNFFFVNPATRGLDFSKGKQKQANAIGGHYCLLGPEGRKWSVFRQPPGLPWGRHHTKLSTSPTRVKLSFSCPPTADDHVKCTSERTLLIERGCSKVEITEKLTNVGDRDAEWCFWDFSQVRGSLDETGKETYSSDIWIYFPLPDERAPENYRVLKAGKLDCAEQMHEIKNEGVMGLQYRGIRSKVFSRSLKGWIAFFDAQSKSTYVKRVRYPQSGAEFLGKETPIEIWTQGTRENPKDPAFIEMEHVSPGQKSRPGESIEMHAQWSAARCRGPVLDVNDVGIISRRLSATGGDGDTEVVLSGEYGVFYEGNVCLIFRDVNGKALRSLNLFLSTPLRPLTVRVVNNRPPGATLATLDVYDYQGRRAGELDRVVLPAE